MSLVTVPREHRLKEIIFQYARDEFSNKRPEHHAPQLRLKRELRDHGMS